MAVLPFVAKVVGARRALRRWSLGPEGPQQLERWQAVEAHGAALQRLLESPDWTAFQEAVAVHQRLRDLALHAPQTSDEARKLAALEWQTLDQFVRDLRRRVKEGQHAREALSKVTTDH